MLGHTLIMFRIINEMKKKWVLQTRIDRQLNYRHYFHDAFRAKVYTTRNTV